MKSEFIDNLVQSIYSSMYQGLYSLTEKIFSKIQNVLDDGILRSRSILDQTPKEWNGTAFAFIQGVAENAIIPIAGSIIAFIFCWQLVSMVQESNQMHNIKPETMLLLLLKLAICLFVCAKSFDIVCGLFDLGHWAASHIPFVETGSTGNLSNLVSDKLDEYTFGDVMGMLVNLIMTLLAEVLIYVLNIVMITRVSIWYLELLLYASAAPIPFATFMNKEWGQVGTNYLRKMLAMSFEGFFMIAAFGLYEALVINVLSSTGGDEYMMSIVTTCGCGIGLVILLNKVGSISSSVFNAH